MPASPLPDHHALPADPWTEDAGPHVRREVEIEASPAEVWEALATEEGRDRWLEPDPERELLVERADAPSRLVWWWWRGDEPATRVELLVVAAPAGARVVVTESVPAMPTALAPSLSGAVPAAPLRFPLERFLAFFAPVAVAV